LADTDAIGALAEDCDLSFDPAAGPNPIADAAIAANERAPTITMQRTLIERRVSLDVMKKSPPQKKLSRDDGFRSSRRAYPSNANLAAYYRHFGGRPVGDGCFYHLWMHCGNAESLLAD
jgi:hypothetical protein